MSTPIESNTEELQEILQTVYNLPSRSGGSTTPDLVVVVDGSGHEYLDDITTSDVSIESGSLANAIEKIQSGQYASVMLKFKMVYMETTYCQVSYPETVGVGVFNNENTYLVVQFDARYYPRNADYIYKYVLELNLDGVTRLERKALQ